MNELISIIVPIYKVEKYLKACVDSLINQTYENLEIILVDDGSPDNCPKMCDEYAMIDKRIKVIHKKNGGLSDARNAGVMMATGEYVFFVDSDDAIELDTIEWAYSKAVSEKCDIVITTFKTASNTNRVIVCDNKEMFKTIFNKYCWEACGKLVKKELLYGIAFPKDKLYEDLGWTPYIILKANKVYYEDNGKYLYTIRKDSIMGNSKKNLSPNLIEMVENINEYIKNNYIALFDFFLAFSTAFLVGQAISIKNFKTQVNENFRKTLKQYFTKKFKYIIKANGIFWTIKLRVCLIVLFNVFV